MRACAQLAFSILLCCTHQTNRMVAAHGELGLPTSVKVIKTVLHRPPDLHSSSCDSNVIVSMETKTNQHR